MSKLPKLVLTLSIAALSGCSPADQASANSSVTVRLPPARRAEPRPGFSVELKAAEGASAGQVAAAVLPAG